MNWNFIDFSLLMLGLSFLGRGKSNFALKMAALSVVVFAIGLYTPS